MKLHRTHLHLLTDLTRGELRSPGISTGSRNIVKRFSSGGSQKPHEDNSINEDPKVGDKTEPEKLDRGDDAGEDNEEYHNKDTGEVGGPRGPEPTRFGDWERKGRCSDF